MDIHRVIAYVVAKIANTMAAKACGAASVWGTYQPKEPQKSDMAK